MKNTLGCVAAPVTSLTHDDMEMQAVSDRRRSTR